MHADDRTPAPTWPIAGLSLLVGFAVAEITGVRALGGVVLGIALVWCFVRWQRELGTRTAVELFVVYDVAFAVSHLLGRLITAWPAVVLTAITVAAITYRIENAP